MKIPEKIKRKAKTICMLILTVVMFLALVVIGREVVRRMNPFDVESHRNEIAAKAAKANGLLDDIATCSEDGKWTEDEIMRIHNNLILTSVHYDVWAWKEDKVYSYGWTYPTDDYLACDHFFENYMKGKDYSKICAELTDKYLELAVYPRSVIPFIKEGMEERLSWGYYFDAGRYLMNAVYNHQRSVISDDERIRLKDVASVRKLSRNEQHCIDVYDYYHQERFLDLGLIELDEAISAAAADIRLMLPDKKRQEGMLNALIVSSNTERKTWGTAIGILIGIALCAVYIAVKKISNARQEAREARGWL